jgi:predicted NAD-dependent protein-ADP-ribosyltransferase YbiA (DUF1768 family)
VIECPICQANKTNKNRITGEIEVEALPDYACKCMECGKEISQKKFYCLREGVMEHFCSKKCINKWLVSVGRMVAIEVKGKDWLYLNGTKKWGYEKRYMSSPKIGR